MLATLLCASCAPSTEERIAAKVQDNPDWINLGRIVTDEWDRVCVIGPYTPPQQVERMLGFGWSGARRSGIATREEYTLLVFVRGDDVVEHVMFPRSDGDFAPVLGRNFCLRRAEAVFRAQASTQQPDRMRVTPVRP